MKNICIHIKYLVSCGTHNFMTRLKFIYFYINTWLQHSCCLHIMSVSKSKPTLHCITTLEK